MTSLNLLHKVLREVEALVGTQSAVIFESTPHHHTPITQVVEQQNCKFMIANPLVAHKAN